MGFFLGPTYHLVLIVYKKITGLSIAPLYVLTKIPTSARNSCSEESLLYELVV
jgi:hypothetical protein